MKKIDFKQPKYIFPLVILVPLLFLAYTLCSLFSPDEDYSDNVGLQTELPDAKTEEMKDKYSSMYLRYGNDEDAYSALDGLTEEVIEKDSIESAYTDEEKARLKQEAQQRAEMEANLREIQANMSSGRRSRMPMASGGYRTGGADDRAATEADNEVSDYAMQIKAMQEAQAERQKMLARALGLEEEKGGKQDSIITPVKAEPPMLVLRDQDANADRFNTIGDAVEKAENTLIRAMIDKTTKAQQGTRLRFKLLDDITIKDIKLKKGTYLYGTVVGFSEQRVMATITSVMVGNRFLNVDLSVYDNDGMEGFYVPASAFREFIKKASAGVTQQNININSGYGNEISGESLALQALQNVYNSATQAISANIRKNKANIKYNTVVYLVNSRDAE